MNSISMTEKFTPIEPTYDPALDAYTDVVLFPKKVEMATEHFKKYALPHFKKLAKKTKKPPLTPLQAELLATYTFEATESQMQQLKAFLQELFSEQLLKANANEVKQLAA